MGPSRSSDQDIHQYFGHFNLNINIWNGVGSLAEMFEEQAVVSKMSKKMFWTICIKCEGLWKRNSG